MLPGSWAYVSAGAFGRAIIVSSVVFLSNLYITLTQKNELYKNMPIFSHFKPMVYNKFMLISTCVG
jgi:hypothetical protein